MEQGLRDCCRSIRIGKILVESDLDTHAARVVYARFPEDIARRQVSICCTVKELILGYLSNVRLKQSILRSSLTS